MVDDFMERPQKESIINPRRGKIFNFFYRMYWKNLRPKYRKIRKGTIENSKKTFFLIVAYKTFILFSPILIFAFYTFFIQTKQFEVKTSVIIENKSQNNTVQSPFANLVGNGGNLKDLHLLVDYLNSYTVLEKLNFQLHLRNEYEKIYGIDIFSSLISSNKDAFLRYHKKHLYLEINEDSGILIIKYTAPKVELASNVVKTILKFSEDFLNEINKEVLLKEVSFYEKELENIMIDIRKTKKLLSLKQIETEQISPSKTFESESQSIIAIESDLVKSKAELSQLESYLNPNSLQVMTAKDKISSLQQQIKELKKGALLKEQNGDSTFSSVSFATAEMELTLLVEKYKMAMEALEQHKFNAIHNAKHLVQIEKPYIPNKFSYPKRITNILIFSLLYLAVIFIIKVTIEVIHEHKYY